MRNGALYEMNRVLDLTMDPINQLFFHSRMLRTWGHSLGAARHEEWLAKMRRCHQLGAFVVRGGLHPTSRAACDLEIGHDVETVLASDRLQTQTFLGRVEVLLEDVDDDDARALLMNILEAERADLARLESWLSGPEVQEIRPAQRSDLAKPGHEFASIAAIDSLLPAMTAAVSQIFLHSMIFEGGGHAELANRELNAALRMMYRTEAALERLQHLGGLPSGRSHGAMTIVGTDRGASETALAVHQQVLVTIEEHLPRISGLGDPVSWTLIDGLHRATRDEVEFRLGDR